MRVVGIRELKARLSEYLRDVRRGEAFLVTDRNVVVAELRPPGTNTPVASDDVAWRMDELARAGDMQPRAWAGKAGPGGRQGPVGPAAPPGRCWTRCGRSATVEPGGLRGCVGRAACGPRAGPHTLTSTS